MPFTRLEIGKQIQKEKADDCVEVLRRHEIICSLSACVLMFKHLLDTDCTANRHGFIRQARLDSARVKLLRYVDFITE